MTTALKLQPWTDSLPWASRHYEEGDIRCTCMLCGAIIGTTDTDPRRDQHDPDCVGCSVCEIAIRLWKGEGKHCKEQRYHTDCFARVLAPNPTLGPVDERREK